MDKITDEVYTYMLDDILDVLYMQGEDAGKLNYGSAVHQITAVNEAKQAIQALYAPTTLPTLTNQNNELREQIADVLAQYDRSRSTPTGDAVEIEIEASDRLVIYATDEIASVLDRIEAATPDYCKMDSYNRSFLKAMYENTIGKAIQADQASIDGDGYNYVDNDKETIVDTDDEASDKGKSDKTNVIEGEVTPPDAPDTTDVDQTPKEPTEAEAPQEPAKTEPVETPKEKIARKFAESKARREAEKKEVK